MLSWVWIPVAMAPAAATGPQAPSPPPEIIITGERAQRTRRQTASSVVVLDARAIRESPGADRLDQLLAEIPNVQPGSGGDGPAIRGQDTTGALRDLSALLGGTRPRTTLVVDGRAVTYNELAFGVAPLWDVARVELFRSPQSLTQGRNSIAGAIFVATEDPVFTPFAAGRAILGDARTRQLSLALSGPLANGLAARLSGDWRTSRPSSRIGTIDPGVRSDRDDHATVRGKLLWEPGGWPGARIALVAAHARSLAPQIEGLSPPFEDRRNPNPGYGIFRNRTSWLTALAEAGRGGPLTGTLVASAGQTRIRRHAAAGFGETVTRGDDRSAEFRIAWRPAAGLSLVGGAAYQGADADQAIDLSQLVGTGRFRDEQGSLGLFAEVEAQLTDRLLLTAGLRRQRDRQDRSGSIGVPGDLDRLDYRGRFSAWLPKLGLAFDPGPSLRVGVMVHRGYNPGGIALRLDDGRSVPFAAETLWNAEAFVRARLGTGGPMLSANLFHSWFRDSQRAVPIVVRVPDGRPVTFAEIVNVPRARSLGAEVALDGTLGPAVTWRAGLGLLDTRIGRDGAPDGLGGRSFQRAPPVSASAHVRWTPISRLILSAQLRHHGAYFSDDRNDPARQVPAATIVDARAALEGRGFTLFGYARNLFDRFALTYVFGPNLATAQDPREVGIGIEKRF